MNGMKELDHLRIELAGRNLIEASAGTGKTYAIACLYLRLVVELDLAPEEILVVTYTEAATEELRGRIRARLREALQVCDGTGTDDPFLQGLFAGTRGTVPERAEARARLDRALKSFDQASIFTIHGFCLRALQDNAFESGSLYDTELVTDQADLVQEVVDDFWRRHFFAEPAPLLRYALRKKLTPDYFAKFLKGMIGDPKLRILPEIAPEGVPAIEARVAASFAALQRGWQERGEEIRRILETDAGLSRAEGLYREDGLPALFEGMELYAAGSDPYDLFETFRRFTPAGLAEKRKKKGAPLLDPFFDLCDELLRGVDERFLALRCELLAFAGERLPALKRERNVRCFDDLLTTLYDALRSDRGEALAESLRQKYRAALIDEFQDTDPVQFDIFRTVYALPDSPLFLIGDPKQAIYSFRGADIFAYLEASRNVEGERRFTLTRNWRSAPRLLDAFNAVFGASSPFVFDDIRYHPAQAGKEEEGERLALDGADEAPLQIWHLPADDNGKEATVARATKTVPVAVAAEIARLLEEGRAGRALLDGSPVLPEHIAVIVRSHKQAGQIQDSLRELGVPSVMRSDKSIFETAEARDVCTLLTAIAAPGSEAKVRAALVTDILGLKGEEIASLLDDEPAWEGWLAKFKEWHQIWVERGFMVMAQALMSCEGVRGRLLPLTGGERRLTNLLHCFELLHAASHERRLGAEGLVTWLGERISEKDQNEAYQIRLETDEKAVKILTIHVSKGLEYPIVFCPFLWGGIRGEDEIISYHEGYRLTKDFGSPGREAQKAAAQKESLAEYLRLLYVALTRAKFRCYLVAGKISSRSPKNRPETSPLSYLFHASEETRAAHDLVGALANEVKGLSLEEVAGHLEGVAARDPGAIAVSPMPEPEGAPRYALEGRDAPLFECERFPRVIGREWRVASFTSLAAHDHPAALLPEAELPDRDETVTGEPSPVPADPQSKSIFTFPRGARAGIFLHEIFEKLDFSLCRGEKPGALVQGFLEKHRFDEGWGDAVRDMVDHVANAPLSAPEGPFALADLQKGKWLCELEFFFPLKFVTSATLREFFRRWSGSHDAVDLQTLTRSLRFTPVTGMVMGFIDMVFEHGGRFYLVDWKSNHLGYRLEDYGKGALRRAMEERLYTLQYLLYTVALNRYLSLRVPGYDYATHFGGVIYWFLRGVSKERGEEYGVFRDTPPAAMIDELTECLIEAGG